MICSAFSSLGGKINVANLIIIANTVVANNLVCIAGVAKSDEFDAVEDTPVRELPLLPCELPDEFGLIRRKMSGRKCVFKTTFATSADGAMVHKYANIFNFSLAADDDDDDEEEEDPEEDDALCNALYNWVKWASNSGCVNLEIFSDVSDLQGKVEGLYGGTSMTSMALFPTIGFTC